MQRRLFYIAMAAVCPTDEAFAVTYLPEPLLRVLLGGTYGSFKDDLEAAAHGLVGTSFRLRKEKGGWSVSSVFHRIEYIHPGETSKEGEVNYQPFDLISVQLHSDLLPYLVGLKGSYNSQVLKIVLDLPIARSHKLYELLLHEGYAGKRREVVFSREDLKAFLEMDGEYEKFRDLRRVIDRCREHIEAMTDQRFSYEGVREGRKVTKLRFEVWYESAIQGMLPLGDTQFAIEEMQAASELISVGYTQNAYEAVQTYGVREIHAVVAEVRQAIKAGRNGAKPIYNPGGFTATRLKERADLSRTKAVLAEVVVLPPEEPTVDVAGLAELLVSLFETYRREAAAVIWAGLSEEDRTRFLSDLEGRLDRFQADLLQKFGRSGKSFEMFRNRVLLEDHGEQVRDLRRFVADEGLFAEHSEAVKSDILKLAEAKLG